MRSQNQVKTRAVIDKGSTNYSTNYIQGCLSNGKISAIFVSDSGDVTEVFLRGLGLGNIATLGVLSSQNRMR